MSTLHWYLRPGHHSGIAGIKGRSALIGHAVWQVLFEKRGALSSTRITEQGPAQPGGARNGIIVAFDWRKNALLQRLCARTQARAGDLFTARVQKA